VHEHEHDLIAEPGDCVSEVPAEQLEREAADLRAEYGGRLPNGEDPGDEERV